MSQNRPSYPQLCANCGGQYDHICFSAKCKDARARSAFIDDYKGMYLDASDIPTPKPEKPTLKLYEVTVMAEHGVSIGYKYKEVLVTILAENTAQAMEFAEISLGVTDVSTKVLSLCKEIKGPFINGYILATRDK